jgi:glyoxylase-like metal-dependent hydrolase (beta-lactamase superfamily II)
MKGRLRAAKTIIAVAVAIIAAAGCSRKPDVGGTGLIRLGDGVYALIASGPSSAEGLGANSGFVVGDESVLVIDSRFTPDLAGELLGAIRSVTDLPIRYLVNTHYHPDHVWGNSVFRSEGAVILAREETVIEMERFSPVYKDYYRDRKPDVYEMIKEAETVLPDSIVGDRLEIDLGGIDVIVSYFGPCHTAGDLVVSVPARGVVFTGGIVSNGYHPNMGDQGADYDNWLKTLGRLENDQPGIVVPGQGRAGDAAMIDLHRRYMIDLAGMVVDAIRRGKILSDSIQKIRVPTAEGYLQDNLLPFNIQAIYRARAIDVTSPRVEMDIPSGFVVSDAAGGPEAGMIQWIAQLSEGYLELELSWQPTSRSEVIVEDINDRIARYAAGQDGLYDFATEGSRRVLAGEDTAPAVYGRWAYRATIRTKGEGAWLWAMTILDGRVYSIRMLTNTGGNQEFERKNIAALEEVVATLRRINGR